MNAIKNDFFDPSIIRSPILFFLGYISFNYSQNSLNLLFCIIVPLSLIYNLRIIFYLVLKREKVKSFVPKIIILLSPLLLFPILKIAEVLQKEKTIIEAKNDEGLKLYLYSNNQFKFTTQSLLGTDIDRGRFAIVNNKVKLKFSNSKSYEIDTLNLQMNKDSILPINNNLMASFLITKHISADRK